MPENLVSRDGFSRPVPRQPAHLHTQAESGAYLRDSSRVPRRRPCMKPPYAIGSVPSLSGHAVAYRWRSLPRVRRHMASKPQGSSERVLPWQITIDQLIFASLSHTHYWYEVSMLKVPAGTNTERAGLRLDGTAKPVSRDQIHRQQARTGTGKYSFALFSRRGVQRLAMAGIRQFRSRGGHQNSPFRG